MRVHILEVENSIYTRCFKHDDIDDIVDSIAMATDEKRVSEILPNLACLYWGIVANKW